MERLTAGIYGRSLVGELFPALEEPGAPVPVLGDPIDGVVSGTGRLKRRVGGPGSGVGVVHQRVCVVNEFVEGGLIGWPGVVGVGFVVQAISRQGLFGVVGHGPPPFGGPSTQVRKFTFVLGRRFPAALGSIVEPLRCCPEDGRVEERAQQFLAVLGVRSEDPLEATLWEQDHLLELLGGQSEQSGNLIIDLADLRCHGSPFVAFAPFERCLCRTASRALASHLGRFVLRASPDPPPMPLRREFQLCPRVHVERVEVDLYFVGVRAEGAEGEVVRLHRSSSVPVAANASLSAAWCGRRRRPRAARTRIAE